ncbi:AAA family ATPase, partial [Nostoc sp. NIES-2111]
LTSMATMVSCVNLKGGVGKTALAVNLAAYAGRVGKRTLLIDLDPQTNATFSCVSIESWEDHANTNGTVADLLGLKKHNSAEDTSKNVEDVIIKNVFPNVDLIPSHLDLFTIDLDLSQGYARESKLKRAIANIIDSYDLIVCDCPPNLTIPTQNALALSQNYIVPISPDYLSGIGVALLIGRVKDFADAMQASINLTGIVMSRVGRPAQFREQTTAALRQTFKNTVISHEIKEKAKVAESASAQRNIFDYDPHGSGREFESVCQELLTRMGV